MLSAAYNPAALGICLVHLLASVMKAGTENDQAGGNEVQQANPVDVPSSSISTKKSWLSYTNHGQTSITNGHILLHLVASGHRAWARLLFAERHSTGSQDFHLRPVTQAPHPSRFTPVKLRKINICFVFQCVQPRRHKVLPTRVDGVTRV